MAGPWEKYARQAQEPVAEPAVAAGPWTRYQQQGAAEPAPPAVEMPAYDPMGNATGGSMAVEVPQAAGPGGDALTAFWRGGGQGTTLGFGDEVMGLASAAGGGDYATSRDATRAANDAAHEAHPWAYNTGKIIGGVAAPIAAAFMAPAGAAGVFGLGASAAARAAVPFGTQVLNGMRTGFALGGVQGFGEAKGDLPEQALDTGLGAGMGAAFGGAVPLAGHYVGRGVQAANDWLQLRGVDVPGLGRRAANVLTDAFGSSPAGTVEQELARLGPDAMLADASPSLKSLAQGAAARPEGNGRNTVVGALKARDEGANARLMASLDENLGPAPVPSQIEGQFRDIRRQAGEMYGQATGNAPPVDTLDVLTLLGQRLNTAEGAEKAALLRARDMLMTTDRSGVSFPKTDARNLHAIKGELDNVIRYGDPTIGAAPGTFSKKDGALFGVRAALNDALEGQVPGYANANLMARTAHGASEALESGLGLHAPTIHPYDFAQGFNAAPIEQQAATRLGARANLDAVVGNNRNDIAALDRRLQAESDWNRSKFGTAFGEEPVANVARDIDREQAFRQLYTDVDRGAQSAQRLKAADAQSVREVNTGVPAIDIALGTSTGGPVGAALPLAVRGAKFGVNYFGRASDIARNEQVAEAITRQGPEIQALVEALRKRSDVKAGLDTTVGDRAKVLAQIIADGSFRNSEAPDKARRLGRLLMEMQPR